MQALSDAALDTKDNAFKIELLEVDIMKLHNIDVQNLSFKAMVWLQFVVRGGAADPYLNKGTAIEFPTGEDGQPMFRPSIAWYMNEVDFRNALSFRRVDMVIKKSNEDLVVSARYDGVFSEIFELEVRGVRSKLGAISRLIR